MTFLKNVIRGSVISSKWYSISSENLALESNVVRQIVENIKEGWIAWRNETRVSYKNRIQVEHSFVHPSNGRTPELERDQMN